jgi:FtsP/CotA-like multicopper oxidase with cupredoxin domain
VAQNLGSFNPSFSEIEKGRDWWGANGGSYTHQRCDEFFPQKYYQLDVQEISWRFHTDLPPTTMWAYGPLDPATRTSTSSIPGPMIQAKYGEPIVIRINNKLPANHVGFGSPETATHLHNMHSPAESDGFPGDFVTPSNYRDQAYPMCSAGYDQYRAVDPVKYPDGDPREVLNTLWYHDHRFNFTSHNVYKGLFGFFNAFDSIDCNDETGALFPATSLRLPSGKYDVMLGFQDPQFDNSGNIFFNVFDTDGHLGDKIACNGKIQPFMNVEARKYRFRLLDGGPSRFYQFFLAKGGGINGTTVPAQGYSDWKNMSVIANDGNLLPSPINSTSVLLGVANRMDVVIDFSLYKPGDTLYLMNRLVQLSGRGPTYELMNPGYPVLQFRVQPLTAPDNSKLPSKLRDLPVPTATELGSAVQRSFVFGRANGGWTVNGVLADISAPFTDPNTGRKVTPKQGTCEIWTLQNNSGSWSHPVHIHFEEFQILDRNGVKPGGSGYPFPYEVSRKDVLVLRPNESVRLFFRFRDFLGHYVMHCHNVVHEDHAMMIRWDIVP